MSLKDELIETYCNNFVAYYRAHSCHLNVTGRNFVADHELLGAIYEDLQAEVDTLGEIMRTMRIEAPNTLKEILDLSDLSEETTNGADGMLQITYDAVEELISDYKEIEESADSAEYAHISNHAQDRVLTLEKFCWQLRSTLE